MKKLNFKTIEQGIKEKHLKQLNNASLKEVKGGTCLLLTVTICPCVGGVDNA